MGQDCWFSAVTTP